MSQSSKERLLCKYIVPKKQGAKRHYGIHPYFTRRPWNVVQEYIAHYAANPSSIVLDPFGGSGVTAIEAAVLGKVGIHYDINPLANFIAREVALPNVNLTLLEQTGLSLIEQAKKITRQQTLKQTLSRFWYPTNIKLPKNADAEFVEELFSTRQLAQLSILRQLIDDVKSPIIRGQLLLAFSGALGKTNRTFVSAKNRAETRGGSTILSLYRYHVPKSPVELFPIEQFQARLQRLLIAKRETNALFSQSGGNCQIRHGSAIDLKEIKDKTVDYVFTDPPYGSYIQYLDLSIMWNAWLRLAVPKYVTQQEIVASNSDGGLKYFSLLSESAKECFRVLKPNSYLSLVFCHRDLSYWKKIYEIFTNAGFAYKISVPQPLNAVWSMHKKKFDLAAVAGEVIITFRKEKNDRLTVPPIKSGSIDRVLRNAFGRTKALTTDELFLRIVPSLYESGILNEVGNSKLLISDFLGEYVEYDEKARIWTLA